MKKRQAKITITFLSFLFSFFFCHCTFDYGENGSSSRELPDLVMYNVDYVRVRSADPIAKFFAEVAERYEQQGIMKLQNFSFEQYGENGEEINSSGNAGFAVVGISSGDISMSDGVRFDIESEDIVIETEQLEWIDEQRFLSSGEEDEVDVYQSDGTNMRGIGLRADVRGRTWEFTGSVSGTFVHEDEDDDETGEE